MRALLWILGLGLLLSACGKRQTFPDTPAIRFETLSIVDAPNPSVDSAQVTVYFTDGNGDLGLTSEERQTGTYAKYPPGVFTNFNLRYYNFFFTLYAENASGVFDSIAPTTADTAIIVAPGDTNHITFVDELSTYGAFQPTLDMQKGEPLEGYITFTYKTLLFALNNAPPIVNAGRIIKGKRYFAVVRIMDRAGHMSNKVTSDTLTWPLE